MRAQENINRDWKDGAVGQIKEDGRKVVEKSCQLATCSHPKQERNKLVEVILSSVIIYQ